MAQSMPDETSALLTRLSQKPGVQSTLILSRSTGAIVRTTGLISTSPTANPNSTLPSSIANETPNGSADGKRGGGMKNAEEVARMVWGFVQAAGGLVEGLQGEGEDEVKLLRLRTRKNELVIVPDAKFLLVVIHDTPPA